MSVSVNADPPATNVHYLRLIRKIQDAASWPEFLVLYVDGNLRLKPHPPSGMPDTCFGTSVIVGPADIAFRPFTVIASIRCVSVSNLLEVTYAGGGTAAIQVLTVSRSQALVRVTANYPMDNPFATFRSMFLQDGLADADQVRWRTVDGDSLATSVSAFPGGEGTEWYLFKATPSTVRPSAPNIRIAVENP